MRYFPFAFWAAGTFVLVLAILSDFAFGRGDAKRLGVRLLLAFIWPFAALSRAGRNLLFTNGRNL